MHCGFTPQRSCCLHCHASQIGGCNGRLCGRSTWDAAFMGERGQLLPSLSLTKKKNSKIIGDLGKNRAPKSMHCDFTPRRQHYPHMGRNWCGEASLTGKQCKVILKQTQLRLIESRIRKLHGFIAGSMPLLSAPIFAQHMEARFGNPQRHDGHRSFACCQDAPIVEACDAAVGHSGNIVHTSKCKAITPTCLTPLAPVFFFFLDAAEKEKCQVQKKDRDKNINLQRLSADGPTRTCHPSELRVLRVHRPW